MEQQKVESGQRSSSWGREGRRRRGRQESAVKVWSTFVCVNGPCYVRSKPLVMFSTATLGEASEMKTRSQNLREPSRLVMRRASFNKKMYLLLFFLRFSSQTSTAPSLSSVRSKSRGSEVKRMKRKACKASKRILEGHEATGPLEDRKENRESKNQV